MNEKQIAWICNLLFPAFQASDLLFYTVVIVRLVLTVCIWGYGFVADRLGHKARGAEERGSDVGGLGKAPRLRGENVQRASLKAPYFQRGKMGNVLCLGVNSKCLFLFLYTS